MVLQGKDMMIMLDGAVVAASKSCTVDVQCDSIAVSSLTDGEWEHLIPGRKSWTVQTNHLIRMTEHAKATVEAISTANSNNGPETYGPPQVIVNNKTHLTGEWQRERGITIVFPFLAQAPKNFDTYGNASNTAAMAAYINELEEGTICAIVTFDAFGIDDELKTALESAFMVDLKTVMMQGDGSTLHNQRGALVVMGQKGSQGIMAYSPPENQVVGSLAHTKMYFNAGALQNTPVKNNILRVGKIYELTMQVEGYALDKITGKALCKQCKMQFTRGNLATGSLTFTGNGPLS